MNILLINPLPVNQFDLKMDRFIVEERGFYPPLGILSIATYIDRRTSHQAEVLDCEAEQVGYDVLPSKIEAVAPDVVGISSTTFTIIDTLKIAETVKHLSERIHVCLGGPHLRIYPYETISKPNVDSVVIGEGEFVFADLLDRLEAGETLEGLPGVLFKGPTGAIRGNDEVVYVEDLDSIPFPDRRFIRNELYWSVLSEVRPSSTIMTTRGCPYRCRFCLHDRRFRRRSVPHVMEEIEHCLKLGIRDLYCFDESFGAHKGHALELCNAISTSGLDFSWHVRVRLNAIDDDLIAALKRSGCRRLQIGVEAGTQEILDNICKDISLKGIDALFRKLNRAGFELYVDFMIGLPGEREAEIKRTIDLAKRLPIDFVQFSIFAALPATDIYLDSLKSGLIKRDYWRDFARNPNPDFVPGFWTEYFSSEQLLGICRDAIREFYFRPRYIWRRLSAIGSLKEFWRVARLALRLLFHTLPKRT